MHNNNLLWQNKALTNCFSTYRQIQVKIMCHHDWVECIIVPTYKPLAFAAIFDETFTCEGLSLAESHDQQALFHCFTLKKLWSMPSCAIYLLYWIWCHCSNICHKKWHLCACVRMHMLQKSNRERCVLHWCTRLDARFALLDGDFHSNKGGYSIWYIDLFASVSRGCPDSPIVSQQVIILNSTKNMHYTLYHTGTLTSKISIKGSGHYW